MTEANYKDDLLLLNTLVQAESQLPSLEHAVRSIGHYMNAERTEFMF